MDRLGLWPLRVGWLLVPPAIGPGLDAALAGTEDGVSWVVLALGWTVWFAGFASTLIPRTASLTVVRLLAPLVLAAATWAATGDGTTTVRAVGLGWAALVGVVSFSPVIGEFMVDGSSYGDERRLLLRVPAPLLLGPIVLAWLVPAASLVSGALLLATERWVAGAAVALAAAVTGRAAVLRLHQLSRRWLVFVPAGLVIHDPLALTEPILFPRSLIAGFAPAPADTQALDLTRSALGLALELRAMEPITLTPLRPGADAVEVTADSVLVTPTRPGRALAVAAERGIPVGVGEAPTAVPLPRRRPRGRA